jgi:radical SAM family RiPP maturation amino acid epimerase
MTEHELSLIKKNLDEMSPEDAARVMTGLSNAKRLVEIISLIPGSREEYLNDKEGFIDKYNVNLSVKESDFLIAPSDPDEKIAIISDGKRLAEMPESFFRFRQFTGNKIVYRNRMIKELCEPQNERMKKWRRRQIKRCDGALGGLNDSFVHTVVTYELNTGCSVGCSFCGLDAGPLRKIFRYTPENAKLFRGVLGACHRVLGDAAGHGMMYFATEPLDNPDYEKFEADHYEEFHIIPQITTAVPDRDIERTRYFIREITNGRGFIHRFTIRSEEMARKVLESFSPEELLQVELLPQFPEAPAFVPYVKTGRQAEAGNAMTDADQGTICCVDGFCINFPDRRFRLISPARTGKTFPKGIYESEWVTFADADDFEQKLRDYIDDELEQDIPKEGPLRLYNYMSVGEYKGNSAVISKYGLAIPMKEKYMERIARLLEAGDYTRSQIVEIVTDEGLTAAENAYWYLNRLWDNGCIVENIFQLND